MLNVLIIDDEPLAQDVLETYVSQFPELKLVAKCLNAIEANEWLKSAAIDLIFLDIQMPMISGLDFLKTLKNPPLVIITTAYPNHAIEGFELNVLDYLLKPISMERFIKAINKAFELQQLHKNKTLEKVSTEKEPEDYFFVKADKKLIKINHNEIIYIEGLKDLVPLDFRYPPEWTANIFNYSKFAPDLTGKIKHLIENYDFYIPLIKEQQTHLFETFYDSEPIIKEIFGN